LLFVSGGFLRKSRDLAQAFEHLKERINDFNEEQIVLGLERREIERLIQQVNRLIQKLDKLSKIVKSNY
jgi:hypothetical protein